MAAAGFDGDAEREAGVLVAGYDLAEALGGVLVCLVVLLPCATGRLVLGPELTLAARGVISMVISFPSSSFRGL